jgi:hypothetical protein
VFTARYGLIPYMKHVTFRRLKVNITIHLNSVTATSDNNGIRWTMFRLRSVPVLSGVVTFLSSFVVLTPNVNF